MQTEGQSERNNFFWCLNPVASVYLHSLDFVEFRRSAELVKFNVFEMANILEGVEISSEAS